MSDPLPPSDGTGFSVTSARAALPGLQRPPTLLRLAPSSLSIPPVITTRPSPRCVDLRGPTCPPPQGGSPCLVGGHGGQTWPWMALAVPLTGHAEDPCFIGDGCHQKARSFLLLGSSGDVSLSVTWEWSDLMWPWPRQAWASVRPPSGYLSP